MLKSLAEEKEKYKRLYEKTKPEIDKLSILKSCLANKVDYETLKLAFGHYENNYNKEEKEDKLIMEEKTKNTTNASTNQVLANK